MRRLLYGPLPSKLSVPGPASPRGYRPGLLPRDLGGVACQGRRRPEGPGWTQSGKTTGPWQAREGTPAPNTVSKKKKGTKDKRKGNCRIDGQVNLAENKFGCYGSYRMKHCVRGNFSLRHDRAAVKMAKILDDLGEKKSYRSIVFGEAGKRRSNDPSPLKTASFPG